MLARTNQTHAGFEMRESGGKKRLNKVSKFPSSSKGLTHRRKIDLAVNGDQETHAVDPPWIPSERRQLLLKVHVSEGNSGNSVPRKTSKRSEIHLDSEKSFEKKEISEFGTNSGVSPSFGCVCF